MPSPHARLELVVRPAAAVAHAAAHFAAHPSERVRFREHLDPCCFLLDVFDGSDKVPARCFIVIAWPDRDGSRVEVERNRGGELLGLCTLALLCTLVTGQLLGPWSLMLLPVYGVAAKYLIELTARRQHVQLDHEALTALERAFAPLRRTGLPFREPAALPEPDPPATTTPAREP